MAIRPTRPALGERYDRRQQDVVLAAARVFATRGYAETSVAELAEELGLATGALYHYFPGKEQLLIRICDQLMDPLLERAKALLAERGTPEPQFRALVRLWVEHVIERRDHLLVFTQQRHVVDHGEQWAGVRRARKEFERLLDAVLGRALGGGSNGGADEADRALALYALLGMVNHTVQWYRPRGRLTPEAIADGYVDLILGR